MRISIRRVCCLAMWALIVLCLSPAWASPVFVPLGLGGGGGMFGPAISPDDPDFILLTCDMGGVYRSEDGGKHWELLPETRILRHMTTAPPPVFKGARIYWITDKTRPCYSDDKGVTWTILPPCPWEKYPRGRKDRNIVRDFLLVPGKEDELLVSAMQGLWKGRGRTWRLVSDTPGGPLLLLDEEIFAAAEDGGMLRSGDFGQTWQALPGLPGPVAALAGARDAGGNSLMLASVKDNGVYRSRDKGRTWERCKDYASETLLHIPAGQTSTAFALQTGSSSLRQLLRSIDGGNSWAEIFHMNNNWRKLEFNANVELSWLQKKLRWGYYFTRNGFAASAADPNFFLVATQGELFASRDAGNSWQISMARELPPLEDGSQRFSSIGLEVTSCWMYAFDPHEENREYIAYTDVGFARSLDKGESWSWSASGSPWTNTFYDLAFDPDKPGKIYAAASNLHDIPHFMSVSIAPSNYSRNYGGVVVSNNFGASWTTPYNRKGEGSLPRQVCTTVVLDPASPVESRTLYAGIYGEDENAGVHVSTDSGKTWKQTESQPGMLPNRHVYRLRLHPETGDLYCLITGLRAASPNYFNPKGGGIWVSRDKGKSWSHISKGSPFNRWATAFAFDPANTEGLYVASATPQGGAGAGGVFKTMDGGKKWFSILKDEDMRRLAGGRNYDHTMAVAVHPENSDLVFAGTTLHGLFYSVDGGKRWKWCRDFLFPNVQSIAFDPRNPDTIRLTTFGSGVWSGSVQRLIR